MHARMGLAFMFVVEKAVSCSGNPLAEVELIMNRETAAAPARADAAERISVAERRNLGLVVDAADERRERLETLCAEQAEQDVMNKVIHPKRNIDYGVSCRKPKVVTVGVSKKIPDSTKIALVVLILLALVFALRR